MTAMFGGSLDVIISTGSGEFESRSTGGFEFTEAHKSLDIAEGSHLLTIDTSESTKQIKTLNKGKGTHKYI